MTLLSAKQALLNGNKINGRYPVLQSNGKYSIKYLKINKYNKPYWSTKFGTWDTPIPLTPEQNRYDKFICDVLNIYYKRLEQYKNELKESINIPIIKKGKHIIPRTPSLNDEYQPHEGVDNTVWNQFQAACGYDSCTKDEINIIRYKINLMKNYERKLLDAFYLDLIAPPQLSESVEAIVLTDKDGFTYVQAGPGYTTPHLDQEFRELGIFPCSMELKGFRVGNQIYHQRAARAIQNARRAQLRRLGDARLRQHSSDTLRDTQHEMINLHGALYLGQNIAQTLAASVAERERRKQFASNPFGKYRRSVYY